MNEIQLLIEDIVETENLGKIDFIKVKDLGRMGEDEYYKVLLPFRLSLDLFGIEENQTYKMFDLFFVRFQDEDNNLKRITFPIDERKNISIPLIDLLINSLKYIYKVNEDNIKIIENRILDNCCVIVRKNDSSIVITRDNFNELAEIILKSNYTEKIKREKPPKFKNEEQKEVYLIMTEGRKKEEENKKLKLKTIINFVALCMNKLPNDLLVKEMTMYQLLTTYDSLMLKNNYTDSYSQYLAGGDPKKLDLTHWAIKINKL